MTSRPINYKPLTAQLYHKYLTIDNKKIREHKRWQKGKPPQKMHESEIPKLREIKCFACNELVKEGMDVIVLTKISQVRVYHEACGLAKNIEVDPSDIKYPLVKAKRDWRQTCLVFN